MELLRQNSLKWLERTNPLRGLSISRARSIFDQARVKGSPHLQYMYNEIEATDPVLMTCVERRAAALSGLQQQFVAIAGADPVLAQEQRDALMRFTSAIENFGDAVERMDEAFFRGYCHMQPIWEGDVVRHINFLNSWNFMRDNDGSWLWNPACHETIAGLDDIRGARLVSLVRRRAIDYPAIFIYVRKALGERDYGRFIERHGIPHAAIIMAAGTEKKDVPDYIASANAWNNGQDIALPNTADIKLATEARGTDPFTPFVEHQDKYIVLLATGGTLTSLAQADTGSLAGGAQMEVWREIVARDGVLISDAFNRGLFRRYLECAFPGKPIAAEFRLSNDKHPTASEIADLAGKLKVAGWRIKQEELEEAVGYTLEKDDGGQGLTALPSASAAVGQHALPSVGGDPRAPRSPFFNKACNGHSNDLKSTTQNESGRENGVLTAFSKDNGPAAEAVKKLLENPTPESAAALLKDLPTLLPDDPALAAVIADEMAKAMSAELSSAHDTSPDGRGRSPSAPLSNKDGVCTSPNGPAGCQSPTCPCNTSSNQASNGGDDQKPVNSDKKKSHTPASTEQVKKFLDVLPEKISPEEFDSLLTAGFTNKDGAGNTIKYGTLLRDHWDDGSHSSDDINVRKSKLGVVVKFIRESKPMQSGNMSKPNEKVYFGYIGEKAWVAVADEHGEIGAIEMVSYRRDGRKDKRRRA